MGHAGMGIGSQYPINSFESISLALGSGMEGVEIDVQMTKDSVLVLLHDRTLQEQTSLEGVVSEVTWEYIQQGYYKNFLYTNYKIISLEQLFQHLENVQDYKFLLDFKLYKIHESDAYIATYVRALAKVLEKYQMVNHVFPSSHKSKYLEKIKNRFPSVQLVVNGTLEKSLELAKANQAFGIIMQNEDATKEKIRQVHEEGFRVCLFGLYSKNDNLDAIEKNADYLFTDKVKHLMKILDWTTLLSL